MQRRFLRKRGAAGKALLGASGLNSLSQSLTALPAPSGREPLARPGTLHFRRKLSRHAKGPIPEDDFPRPMPDSPKGEYPFRLAAARQATFPKGTAFRGGGKLSRHAKGPISEDDFPRPGEDVTAGDKKGNLSSAARLGEFLPAWFPRCALAPERVKKWVRNAHRRF